MFLGLSDSDREKLSYEVVSNRARLSLTRLLRSPLSIEYPDLAITQQNLAINIARNALGLPIYVLEPDDMGGYFTQDYAWHNGEFELIFRRPETPELIEILIDLLQYKMLYIEDVNEILHSDNVGVYFKYLNNGEYVDLKILSISELGEEKEDKHPNIRILVERMEHAISNEDPTAVLHASASIFETLAKDVVADESIINKSLGSFFEKYRNISNLPKHILDFIIEIFQKRNVEPLAGHGNVEIPKFSKEDAIMLCEFTKAILKIERQLFRPLYIDKEINKKD